MQHSDATTGLPEQPRAKISGAAWLALIAALLGWMFDGLEMGLFPLVARPALQDLLGSAGTDDYVGFWLGLLTAIFLVGAATGGVVFGWLGDRIGRVWAMTLSVFTYAIFMGMCGLATNVYQLLVLRFIAALGMGGEWSLGVALVMEIWPTSSRAFTAGLIGAASNVGFLAIGVVGLGLGKVIGSMQNWMLAAGIPDFIVERLVIDSQGQATGWRLLMLCGALPALLTFFIRLMVPESEKWLHARSKGETSHWATVDMLGVVIGATGPALLIYLWSFDVGLWVRLIGSVFGLAIAVAGYTYPVVRYLQRSRARAAVVSGELTLSQTVGRMLLGACLSGIPLIGTWASLQNAPTWADQLVQRSSADMPAEQQAAQRSEARSYTQIASAMGAIIGTICAAFMGDAIGRRATYILLCIASLIASLAFFQLNTSYSAVFLLMVFLAGGMTASFYGWLPLYLPELFRTSMRATGQGFSYNFGRILGAVGALQMASLVKDVFHGDYPTACSVMSSVYLLGLIVIWFVPETRGKPLPE